MEFDCRKAYISSKRVCAESKEDQDQERSAHGIYDACYWWWHYWVHDISQHISKDIEEAFEEQDDIQNELYEKLTAKVYDRDPDLGECFEKNFIFNGFENNKLYITSYAQDEDRKFLYKHFGIIKTFAQDIFGNDVELDFKKEEPSVLENQRIETQKKEENSFQQEIPTDTGSMIEDRKSVV